MIGNLSRQFDSDAEEYAASQAKKAAEPKFFVSAGDDDRGATRHVDINEAQDAAAERSMQTFHRQAHVHRITGPRIRTYTNGKMSGYLDGNGEGWKETNG
jgi:hypothetical protein